MSLKHKKNIETAKNILNDLNQILNSDFPSKVTESYWVIANVVNTIEHPRKYKTSDKVFFKSIEEVENYEKQRKTGKWLVFLDIKELDASWKKIKTATENGILGTWAKAATARPNPNAITENEKVICIYTYNWLDQEDVYRVEKALRSIGINQTLYYKTDFDTGQGNYKVRGGKHISKYISKGTKNYKKYSLSSLNGIGYSKEENLNALGIKTFDDLLSFDTSRKLTGLGVSSEYINNLKLKALSQIENKVFRLSPVHIPDTGNIYFDIETDLYTKHEHRRVWSIALHNKNKVEHFYAESWKEEKKILTEFIKYSKANRTATFFSYSGFDVSVLKHALTRHKLDVNFFLNLNHVDLCAILKQSFILPIDSYSVKEVGKFFGYKYKSGGYDGLIAAFEYMGNQHSGRRISNNLLNYIKDDVKVMHHIVKGLKNHKEIKDLFDNSRN